MEYWVDAVDHVLYRTCLMPFLCRPVYSLRFYVGLCTAFVKTKLMLLQCWLQRFGSITVSCWCPNDNWKKSKTTQFMIEKFTFRSMGKWWFLGRKIFRNNETMFAEKITVKTMLKAGLNWKEENKIIQEFLLG